MNSEKDSSKIAKAEEPAVVYESSEPNLKGIDRSTFDFDEEFRNGLTPHEAKAESIRKIRKWWGK